MERGKPFVWVGKSRKRVDPLNKKRPREEKRARGEEKN